jgi:gluconokinase
MGVSGTGKSTIAKGVAQALGGRFLDADDYHLPANEAQIASGKALDDTMQSEWLDRVSYEVLRVGMLSRQRVIFACSALKHAYRDRLRSKLGKIPIVYLSGTRALIKARLAQRTDHLIPATLLDSQLADLEAPSEEEGALICDIAQPPEQIIAEICRSLQDAALSQGAKIG